MKQLFLHALAGVFLLLTACKKDNVPTTVVGTVTNQETGQPVAGVPVVVHRSYVPPLSGGGFYDSVTATQTDAQGQYRLSFQSRSTGEYQVKTAEPDLYDVQLGYEGYRITEPGPINQLNFTVTPYKTVTVNAPAGKAGKDAIELDVRSIDAGPQLSTIILHDVDPARQFVNFSQAVRVVPNRPYRFSKITYNYVLAPGTTQYQYQDQTSRTIERTVGYNNTTVINFR